MRVLTHDEALWQEATRIAQYLIGEGIREKEVMLYEQAVKGLEGDMSQKEKKVWASMASSTFTMSLYDAGLAMLQPQSPLRRRIFIMLAILEANPDYTAYFLSKPYPKWYLLKLPFIGAWAVLKVLLGIILVKINL